jgi:hypothetical protein
MRIGRAAKNQIQNFEDWLCGGMAHFPGEEIENGIR